MYDIRGKLVHSFLIIDFTTQGNVLECLFWGNGVVAMTSDMQIFVAEVSETLHLYTSSLATFIFMTSYLLRVLMYPHVLHLKGTAHMDALNSTRKYKLRTGLTANIPYTSMAIVPPLLSRSGLLEVRKRSARAHLSLVLLPVRVVFKDG